MWTKEAPQGFKRSAYYFAIPKTRDGFDHLDVEIVYLLYNGKWRVARMGDGPYRSIDQVEYWWDEPISFPEAPDDVQRED